MCGEMAADPRNLPLLLGIGLDEISVSSNAIPALKRRTSQLSQKSCRDLADRAAACATTSEVDALLDAQSLEADRRPLLDARAVALGFTASDKRHAIDELVDLLFAAGRVDDPRALEDALWARESVYSTGMGNGFAVPHCKTRAMTANSIGILKLAQPIEWGSLDGAPVRMVILLALRDSGDNGLHMRVFSRLARKLMDEGFRERLLNLDDPSELVSRLDRELNEDL
jgi:fructose-specific PTS system IIA-like component